MKHCLLWCVLLFSCFRMDAQILSVYPADSGRTITQIRIIRSDGSMVNSGPDSWIDLSSIQENDTIRVSAPGFSEIITTKSELKTQNFKLFLNSLEVSLPEVLVSSYRNLPENNSALSITHLNSEEINRSGAYSLSNALCHLPGVSELSTGSGISKPSIRGLYGNRVLTLFSGLRFDNQQWQDEHGLGLPVSGIDRVEVIKGPLSVLYGTEAMGGVINIIQNSPFKTASGSQINTGFFSNTLGSLISAQVNNSGKNKANSLILSAESQTDYFDGNNKRVLNSRFGGYNLQSAWAFRNSRFRSINRYYFSYYRFGFIFNDILHFMEVDARRSRNFSGPHHNVMLNLLSSENEWKLKNSTLELNAGFQSNLRSEDEGGSEISLNMHLMTLQYLLRWNIELADNLSLVIANSSQLQSNDNYGKRKLIPDARMAETNASVYINYRPGKWSLELSSGAGYKWIHALLTPGVNSEEKEISPFSTARSFINAMAGISRQFGAHLIFKGNMASGVRVPNLAELSSNGLHEGFYTYELGNPNLKNERNINTAIEMIWQSKYFGFAGSAYSNRFGNFVFLEPGYGEWFGFPVYKYVQRNALIYGTEMKLSIYPLGKKSFSLGCTVSGLEAKLDSGEFLPWMPARKLKTEIKISPEKGKLKQSFFYVNSNYVFAQNLVYSGETSSPAYALLNAGCGKDLQAGKLQISLSLVATNLLNRAYADHLSRIRNFGQLNMGRNILFQIKINHNSKNKPNEK